MAKELPFLTVYGHVTVDQIVNVHKFPELNETVDIVDKKTTLGGTGPNIAVTAARLGVPTALCAFVGDDFPDKYWQELTDSGLNISEMVTVDQYETSQATVINDDSLRTKVIFYQGPQGHASELGVDLVSNAVRSERVHFCTGEPAYYLRLMGMLEGRHIAVDPSQETYRFWPREQLQKALEKADSLFCNEYEARIIEQRLGINSVLDLDLPLIVRTDGARGSVAKVDGQIEQIPCVKAAAAVDATGCGDAYRAGFYAGLYYGYFPSDALVLAATVSSFVLEKVGALTNTPRWDQVLERAKPYLEDRA